MATSTGRNTAPLAAHEPLFRAVEDGDIATIEAYFLQDHVREEVHEVETHNAASPFFDVVFTRPHPRGGGERRRGDGVAAPWYYMGGQPRTNSYRSTLLLDLAVRRGHVDVLKWFFSPLRVATMRATLANLLHATASCAIAKGDTEILELLLTQGFPNFIPHAQQASQITRLLENLYTSRGDSRSADVVRILIAHGADIHSHSNAALTACVDTNDVHCVDALVCDGVCVVGADVLSKATHLPNLSVADYLVLKAGVDWGCSSGPPLHMAARQLHSDTVKFYGTRGFADMDARTHQGRTALMLLLATTMEDESCYDTRVTILCALLRAGVDVTLQDDDGKTAFHYAARTNHAETLGILLQHASRDFSTSSISSSSLEPTPKRQRLNNVLQIQDRDGKTALHIAAESSSDVELLLKYGADPNAVAHDGKTVLECLNLQRLQYSYMRTIMLQLLQYGANPFVVGSDGRMAFDRIQDTAEGKAFVMAALQYF